jgi:hypothetical protein
MNKKRLKNVSESDDHPDRGPPAPELPSQAVEAVSRKLKSGYQQILDEPVPDRFLDLLKQLDANGKDADIKTSDDA